MQLQTLTSNIKLKPQLKAPVMAELGPAQPQLVFLGSVGIYIILLHFDVSKWLQKSQFLAILQRKFGHKLWAIALKGGTPKTNIDKLIPIWAVLLLFSASPPGRPADQQAIQNSTFWSEYDLLFKSKVVSLDILT